MSLSEISDCLGKPSSDSFSIIVSFFDDRMFYDDISWVLLFDEVALTNVVAFEDLFLYELNIGKPSSHSILDFSIQILKL